MRVEYLSHDRLIGEHHLQAVSQPVVVNDLRVAGLPFGDRRALAFDARALSLRLRQPVSAIGTSATALLGRDPKTYTAGPMMYAPRLRLYGPIERVPRSHRYRPTPLSAQVAVFYAWFYVRGLRPALSCNRPFTIAPDLRSSLDAALASRARL